MVKQKKIWKIIIADDDPEVHNITRMVLNDYSFEGRPLKLLSAYSGAEAKQLICANPDTAIILLDVVMETYDAGLQLVRYVREDLKNAFVRIILRTGQPGRVPEKDIVIDFDVNGYNEKTELTVQKLYTTVITALRSYRDLQILEQRRYRLEQINKASTYLFKHQSIKEFANELLAQLVAILKPDDSSYDYPVSCFSALKENNDFMVVAATGTYKKSVGQYVSGVFNDEAIQFIRQAVDNEKSFFHEKLFVGFMGSKNDKQNVIFIKNNRHINKPDRDLIEILFNNAAVAFDNIVLMDTHKNMLLTLGEVIENRSQRVGRHTLRVSLFSHLLALKAGLSQADADLLRLVSPIHDVGKVSVPDSILFKSGSVTPDEFEKIKLHSSFGYEIFKNPNSHIMQAAAIVAQQHHEHWDGSGYPLGLKGEDIHIFGRIVGLADVFDSLTHWRIYKEKWGMTRVLKLIKAQRGSRFAPNLVDIFLENIDAIVEINHLHP